MLILLIVEYKIRRELYVVRRLLIASCLIDFFSQKCPKKFMFWVCYCCCFSCSYFRLLVLYFWDQKLQIQRQMKFCEEESPGSFATEKLRISWKEDHWIKKKMFMQHQGDTQKEWKKKKKEKKPETVHSFFLLLPLLKILNTDPFSVGWNSDSDFSQPSRSLWRQRKQGMFWHPYTFVYNSHFIPILFMFFLQIW